MASRSRCRWIAARASSGRAAPGNLYSTPVRGARRGGAGTISLTLDKVIPAIPAPADTKYVKHERIQSALLTKFWGRPMHLGANVLLPEGWDTHPQARYPLFIYHGHFPYTFDRLPPEPPDPNLKPDFAARFNLSGYNRIQQQYAHQFYKDWTGPGFPRALVIEIQHPTPFYDDSYAVNSANAGPWGDAIVKELLPYLEKKYRGIGQGWARFMYGGSTGGWEAMAAQVFYPGRLQRRLHRVPRSDRLPRLHRRRHLRGRERVLPRRATGRRRLVPGCATTSDTSARRSRR